MKIRAPLIEVKDALITSISEGYGILGAAFSAPQDVSGIPQMRQDWRNKTANYLAETFPTRKEYGQFLYTTGALLAYQMAPEVSEVVHDVNRKVTALEDILASLERYYQFEPESKGLVIQDIDSFEKVRRVNHKQVEPFLTDGALDMPEQVIKQAFSQIIGEFSVPKDWGGETEDLYTTRMLLNGERVSTSILLKGPGTVRGRETLLKDLGKGTNQLHRMVQASASKLYIIQSVKPVAHEISSMAEALITQQRERGNRCYYCIIDGQDTATILYAYGFLKP